MKEERGPCHKVYLYRVDLGLYRVKWKLDPNLVPSHLLITSIQPALHIIIGKHS